MGTFMRMCYRLMLLICTLLASYECAMAHGWMAPKEFSKITNPIIYDGASIARGKEIYLKNCAACHGDKGKGLKAEDLNFKKSPPNLLKRLATHSGGDFFWKIQEGRGEMPSFKDDIEEKDIWDIINFLKAVK